MPQALFYNNLFLSESSKQLDFIKSDFKQGRFAVYQNTVFEVLISSLQLTYPGLWKLLGEKYARQLSLKYLSNQNNFPKNGCLDDWGEDFAEFIRRQDTLKNINYLADYAKLELAYYNCLMANRQEPLEQKELLKYSEDELFNLKIKLRSDINLFESDFDILNIYNYINNFEQEDNSKKEELVLNKNKTNLLIHRSNLLPFKPSLISLDADIWKFVYYIKDSKTLQQAAELVEQEYPEFDLIQGLNAVFSNNLMAAIER